jgi:hypothetical protein
LPLRLKAVPIMVTLCEFHIMAQVCRPPSK